MKFFKKCKDGGPESCVDAYVLIEIKWLFSIMLLRFGPGSREAYHSHAFNAISWILRGHVREEYLPIYETGPIVVDTCVGQVTFNGFTTSSTVHRFTSWRPIVTLRSTFHRVFSCGVSWVLTFRGPWSKTWREHDPRTGANTVLSHGRKIVS